VGDNTNYSEKNGLKRHGRRRRADRENAKDVEETIQNTTGINSAKFYLSIRISFDTLDAIQLTLIVSLNPVIMNIGERAIYQRAIDTNQWIYHSLSKSWFTPEEFSRYVQANGSFRDQENLTCADPCEALSKAATSLYGMMQRRDQFQQRVLAYYKKK
jgi:hypothetical protein